MSVVVATPSMIKQDAEQSVLGAILLDPDCFDEVEMILPYPEYFAKPAHQFIYRAMTQLRNQNEPIDILTLTDNLEVKKLLSKVGGVTYITELASSVPTAANVEHYARRVEEASVVRNLYKASSRIQKAALNGDYEDIEDLLSSAEQMILKIRPDNRGGITHIRDRLVDHITAIEETKADGTLIGHSWGIPQIDALTSGLCAPDLIIIAARPSVGKSALSTFVGAHVSLQTGEPVAIFSQEMGYDQIVNRMLAALTTIPLQVIRLNRLQDDHWKKITNAAGLLHGSEIYVDDTGNNTIHSIAAQSRRLKRKHGSIGAVIIDYLQILKTNSRGRRNRDQELGFITRNAKQLAKELQCPVILLSQLNRDIERRQNKKPTLADLRESGSIEADADIVAFLHRDDDKEYKFGSEPISCVNFLIAKNRNGGLGTVPLAFRRVYQQFVPWERAPGVH